MEESPEWLAMEINEAVRTFRYIVGRHVSADSNLNALMKNVDNDDGAAPDLLNDSEITPGVPCAKFEDESLLVWKQWHSGGIGDAGRYTFHLYYHLLHTTPKAWKRFAHCEYEADEYCGSLTFDPVDGFGGYFRTRKVIYSKKMTDLQD